MNQNKDTHESRNRKVKKVAVLGSGVMGSSIACHFANVGCDVLLLDISPQETTEEKAKVLITENKKAKNRIVRHFFERAVKTKPSPLFSKNRADQIQLGNFDDDMHRIAECDWILEVVVENLKIKKELYHKIEQYRKKGTLVTSNTSGIPITLMAEGRSDDFKKHFCGVHFFNPPRYLKLLEIIPIKETSQSVVDFLMHYGDLYLGKQTVLCKDTPAFIGNRIGVWSLLKVVDTMQKLNFNIDEIDRLTGPAIGRPKSATFRTADLVGIDTLIKVADNLYESLPQEEGRDIFKLPPLIRYLEEQKWFGDKSGQGFYKKEKDEKGKTQILTLDLTTRAYLPKKKIKFNVLEEAKAKVELVDQIAFLMKSPCKVGDFYRHIFYGLFQYASHRIPEISDNIFSIDSALRSGFGWTLGPFEMWDALGVAHSIEEMEKFDYKPAKWVYDFAKKEEASFYESNKGLKLYYEISSQSHLPIPGMDGVIILEQYTNNVVWSNETSQITDIGDGVINFSWNSKSYTLGETVIAGLNHALNIAEQEYRGLVIGHQGSDFSLGANLGLVFMYAVEQDYEEIDAMVRAFQHTVMRIRYSSVPVVVAPRGRTLGGGCEMSMHADVTHATAETYIGLVEMGVGLLPAGGGTKELVKRTSDAHQQGDLELNILQNAFMNIAMAKVSLSAEEAMNMRILRACDIISMNEARQIFDAKQIVLSLIERGYTQPSPSSDIKILGNNALALFLAGIQGMKKGLYISEHDAKIATKIARVMSGGEWALPQRVNEQYLLDLEREAFLSLCGEQKTLERIQAVINGQKPLRN